MSLARVQMIVDAVRCPYCRSAPGLMCLDWAGRVVRTSVCPQRRWAFRDHVQKHPTEPRSDIQTSPVVNSTVILSPVDKNAFAVTQPGPQAWPDLHTKEWRGIAPPQLRKVPPDMPNLIGLKVGRLEVIGLCATRKGKHHAGGVAGWVCRCVCGCYILRRTKALRNPSNENLVGCLRCTRIADMPRRTYDRQVFRETRHLREEGKTETQRVLPRING